MGKRYFYGLSDDDFFDDTDYENAAQYIADTMEKNEEYLIMFEMKISRKSMVKMVYIYTNLLL